MYVLAHGDRAADVEVRARLQPVVDLAAALAQALLDVDLLRLVAREREVQAVQFAVAQRFLPLGLVEEAGIEVLGAEEQPVAAARAGLRALLDEAAERRHAGA